MIILSGDYTGQKLVTPSAADYPAQIDVVPVQRIVSGEDTSEVTVDDTVFDRYSPAVIANEAEIEVEAVFQVPSFESKTPSIATVDQDGNVTRVSDGTAKIHVKTGPITRKVEVVVSQQSGATSDQFNRFATGSAAAHCAAQIDDRIAGKTASEAKDIFLVQNHGAASYQRNPLCWAADVTNITCFSVWNSRGGNTQAGTLLTPRHVALCDHFADPIQAGDIMRWVTMDGVVVNRTVLAVEGLGGGIDIRIALLSEDQPETIRFAKVLPSNWRDYLVAPATSNASNLPFWRVPCLALDAEEHALVNDIFYVSTNSVVCRYPVDSQRLLFNEPIVVGDSGNGHGPIINDEFVLDTTWTSGNAGGGPNYATRAADINAKITALDLAHGVTSGYQLTPVDLSMFTDFS